MAFIGDVVVALRANTSNFTSGMKRADARLQKFQQNIMGVKTALVGLAGAYGLKRLGGHFLDTAASFEAMQIKLDTLTQGKGVETLDKINKWALEMPVNTQEAVAAFTRMQAMGLDPTIKKMETLVDVASIFGDEALGRVSLALGQMSSLGKINAQDLNQLAQVGINARKMLKDAFGMNVEEIQRSGMDIQLVIEEIWKGLDANFSGAAKKSMTSWRGLWATFKSYLVEFERQVMAAGVFDWIKKQFMDMNKVMSEAFHSGRMRKIAMEWAVSIMSAFKRLTQALDVVRLSINGIQQMIRSSNQLVISLKISSNEADVKNASDRMQGLSKFVREYNTEANKILANQAVPQSMEQIREEIERTNPDLVEFASNLKIPGTFKSERTVERALQWWDELRTKLHSAQQALEVLRGRSAKNTQEQEALGKAMLTLTDSISEAEKEIDGLEGTLKAEANAALAAAAATKKLRMETEEMQALGVGLTDFGKSGGNFNNMKWWEYDEASSIGVGLTEFVEEAEEEADKIQDIYTTLASNIRDVMADAFYGMAKDGRISWNSIADTAMRVGSEMLAEATMTYIMMAIQAEISATRQKAALASTGWGIALVAVGAIASQAIKGGAFGGSTGPSQTEKLQTSLDSLTTEIRNLTDELDHQIFMMGENIHEWSEAMKLQTQNLTDALAGIIAGRKTIFGGAGMESVAQSGLMRLNADSDQMKYLRGSIASEFAVWKNFFKEVYINAQEIITEIQGMSQTLGPLATSYEREIENMKASFKNLGSAAKDTLLQNQSNLDQITTFKGEMYTLMQKTAEDLVGPISNYFSMSRDGDMVFDEQKYNWALTKAEKNRDDIIAMYKSQIESLTGLLLSDEDMQELNDFLTKEEAFLRDIEEKYRIKRKDINLDIDRYMMDITGEAGELEKALWGVQDSFADWIGALEDAGASVELITAIEEKRAIAMTAIAKSFFEDLQQNIKDYQLQQTQEEWGINDWLKYIAELDADFAALDPSSNTYYDDALDIATKQWDALKSIDDSMAEQVTALRNTYESIDDLIFELRGGSLAAVQSFEFFSARYQQLMEAAMSPNATSDDVAKFEGFVPDFLEFMQAYTPNYDDLVTDVIGDLEDVQGNILNLISEMTMEEGLLTDIRTVLDVRLTQILEVLAGQDWNIVINNPGGGGDDVPYTEPGDDDGIVTIMPVPDPIGVPITPDIGIPPFPTDPSPISPITIDKSPAPSAPANPIISPDADYSPSGNYSAPTPDWYPTGPPGGGRAEGGWMGSNQIYEVGEKGGEWAMPTYEPERSAFLESTGIADTFRDILAEGGGGGAGGEPIVIENNLYIDGKYVGTIVGEQARKGNPEMLEPLRRSL